MTITLKMTLDEARTALHDRFYTTRKEQQARENAIRMVRVELNKPGATVVKVRDVEIPRLIQYYTDYNAHPALLHELLIIREQLLT